MIVVIGSLFWVIFFVWLYFRIFYVRCYKQAFRYTEENGVWRPFSNVADVNMSLIEGKGFDCAYFVPKEKIRRNLRRSCQKNGYTYVGSVAMKNGFTDNYLRVKRGELQIFQVLHMPTYSEANMEKQNEIFMGLWKQKIEQKYKTDDVSFSFLLCVDMVNKELNERLLHIKAVFQKRGRARLAAVLKFDGVIDEGELWHSRPTLYVLGGRGNRQEMKKYRELREDFLKLMGINERYNGRKYWGDEEQGGEI